jgi:N-acetylmuramoyl-L-alanine amidase
MSQSPPSGAQQGAAQAAVQVAAAAPAERGGQMTVVLDAAHGGTDPGAQGKAGLVEKELTLEMARAVKARLEAAGFRVLMSRSGDENPSFDDRSAVANAQGNAIFFTLHMASLGRAGTARAYYMPAPLEAGALRKGSAIAWDRAQDGFAAESRRLAELVQVQLGQKLPGSPESPQGARVRQLRTVAAPAAAIELASVAAPDRKNFDQSLPRLAEALLRAAEAYRSTQSGVK